jgi:hypothetical protein
MIGAFQTTVIKRRANMQLFSRISSIDLAFSMLVLALCTLISSSGRAQCNATDVSTQTYDASYNSSGELIASLTGGGSYDAGSYTSAGYVGSTQDCSGNVFTGAVFTGYEFLTQISSTPTTVTFGWTLGDYQPVGGDCPVDPNSGVSPGFSLSVVNYPQQTAEYTASCD